MKAMSRSIAFVLSASASLIAPKFLPISFLTPASPNRTMRSAKTPTRSIASILM